MNEFMGVIFVIFAIFWFWNVVLEIRLKAHKNSLLELHDRFTRLENVYTNALFREVPGSEEMETNFGDKP